ncbi:hypothetical protein BGZ76_006296 [Entomortierella beljakovae]|nr:hypothetical protein BGZ76_006296 [Entomortierella beljakovae]
MRIGMAGFWDKPFELARNQREVSPWIEDAYGPDNSAWKKDCLKEMNEMDENDEEEEEVDNEKKKELEIIEETKLELSTKEYGKGKAKAKNKMREQDRDTASRGFLKLLVRCQCIILQDAAGLSTPIFLEFQKKGVIALESLEMDQLQAYGQLVPTLVDVSKGVATKLEEVRWEQATWQTDARCTSATGKVYQAARSDYSETCSAKLGDHFSLILDIKVNVLCYPTMDGMAAPQLWSRY